MNTRTHSPAAFVALLALLLSAATLSPFLTSAAAQFKSGTLTVPVYVTATDQQGRLVPNLVEEDFEVYDNGRKVSLTLFENKSAPISVVVMLDTSGSMTLIMDRVKAGAEQFLIRMLPSDMGLVGAFNDKIEFLPEAFTGDRDVLIRSLSELDFGYPTRLWDAVAASITQLDPMSERKVVLVFTDGEDTQSKVDLDYVLDQARAKEIMVYAIGLSTEIDAGAGRQRSKPDRGLKKLAAETGGGLFLLNTEDELGPTFTRVAQELHSQYVLGFSPAVLDGKTHKLEVKIRKPGLNVRARKSYVATKVRTGPGQ